LMKFGFISSENYKLDSSNCNGANSRLIKAILCAGFYPNIVRRKYNPEGQKRKVTDICVGDRYQDAVALHKHSVCYFRDDECDDFQHFVVHKKITRKNTDIMHASSVSPLSLLLFSDTIDINQEKGVDVIRVNQHIYFQCSPETGEKVINLRKVLRKAMDSYLIGIQSGNESGSSLSNQELVFQTVIDLITTEKIQNNLFDSEKCDDRGMIELSKTEHQETVIPTENRKRKLSANDDPTIAGQNSSNQIDEKRCVIQTTTTIIQP